MAVSRISYSTSSCFCFFFFPFSALWSGTFPLPVYQDTMCGTKPRGAEGEKSSRQVTAEVSYLIGMILASIRS